ncbi:hypothetical protein CRUP_001385 [Coryphaenoides rupestris]|nr:hypothetical protein CRUP_001385 [Coryphaenoides rupestris]
MLPRLGALAELLLLLLLGLGLGLQIDTWMSDILQDNPDVVFVERYGTTHEKRNMKLFKIGERSVGRKKAIWMDCGIHAREWISPAFCQYFVKQILQEYRAGGKMVEMMKQLDFYVTPVLNVDGYVYSWRDNTEGNLTPPGAGRKLRYTRYVEQRKEDLLCFLTIHSYGQLILVPYGNPNLTAQNYDELMKVGIGAANEMEKVHGMTYKVGTSPDILYPNSGSSRDWARMTGIPFSFTFELRDNGTYGFKLPEDQIQPTCQEAYSGAMHIIHYVHHQQLSGAVAAAATPLRPEDPRVHSCSPTAPPAGPRRRCSRRTTFYQDYKHGGATELQL